MSVYVKRKYGRMRAVQNGLTGFVLKRQEEERIRELRACLKVKMRGSLIISIWPMFECENERLTTCNYQYMTYVCIS